MSAADMVNPTALASRRAAAEEIALAAAAIITRYRGRLPGVAYKGALDLVTVADRESEELIVRELARRFPGDRVVAEEGGGAGPRDAELVWYVDPLDGTTNYVRGLTHFAVSIGVAYRGQPVVGVVHAPALVAAERPDVPGVTWAATRGQGATRDGRAITVSSEDTLQRALVATGFPYDRNRTADALASQVRLALTHTLDIRRIGSAAIDLAQVADGTYGLFYEPRLKPWDVAAGIAIVREAGGHVSDFSGADRSLESGEILAGNRRLHADFMARVLA